MPRIRISLPAMLACVVLAAVLPIAGVLGWETYEGLQAERGRTEDELVRSAAGLAQTVDRELGSSVDALHVLSESELFQQGRIAAMGRLLHGRPRRDWDSVFVLDPQGNVVLDTAPRAAPAAAFAELHRQAVGKRAPVVSRVGDAGMAIAVPVMQQNQLRYVLGVRLANTLWARLTAVPDLPAGAQARLYDGEGRLISQSGSAAPAGARLPPDALRAMLRWPSGVQRSTEADGSDVYAAWDRVRLAGWHSRVYVAAAPVDAAHRQSLLHALSTSGAALLAGLLLSGLAAFLVARRVRRSEAALRSRDEALAQSDWRGEFLAMLTHELRNPLGAISAAADVLESTHPTSATAADARSIVSRQARQLSQMMHALLDSTRAIAGTISLSRQPVDLSALVRQVEETLALTGESREHPMTLQLAGDVWVNADPARLEQVVSQLLIHVAKCTPPGEPIEVRTALDGAGTILQVRGKHMRGRPAGTPGIEWTLARALVQLHGGELVARVDGDMNDVIARFAAIAAPQVEGDRALPPSRRRKVLLLQKDSAARHALRAELELEGHTVTVAANEADALSRMVELAPDAALVDFETTGRAAYDFARNARAAGYAGRMVALAADRSEPAVRAARAAGFDDLVARPADRQALRESIESR